MSEIIFEAQNELTICNQLKQRQRFLMNIPPPPRMTLNSPYPIFTKNQLDMRRKFEILQYNKNASQTNKKTKSQKFATVVSSRNNVNVRIPCKENLFKPTWTSASNIPGSPMILQYDPSVPIYNYQTVQNSYSTNDILPRDYTIVVSSDLKSILSEISYLKQGGSIQAPVTMTTPEILLFSLYIENIDSSKLVQYFQVEFPIGLYISGKNSTVQPITGNVSLKNIKLNVYYYPTTDIYYTTNSDISGSMLVNNHSISLNDISSSFTINGKLHYSSPPLDFSGNQYFANVDIKNVSIPVHYGYIYDFKLTYDICVNITSNTSIDTVNNIIQGYISHLESGIIMNSPINTTSNNCSFTSQPYSVLQNYKSFYVNNTTDVI
jgi:hypothetical protein